METPSFIHFDPGLSPEENFRAGQILLIDKPLQWTSFRVVNKIRFLLKDRLGIKKLKVGHAGTLDPLATGLLVVCTGKKTKAITGFIEDRKTYTGTITIGASTPSFDRETNPDQTFETAHIDEASIRRTASGFLGKQQQMPPVFSAKKIEGVRAYKNARAGKEVKLQPREIEVFRFEVIAVRLGAPTGLEVDFLIEASKGTYIRSIAHDFGQRLNSGAYLSALRRIRSGAFSIENAFSPDEFRYWLNTFR